MVTTTTSYLDSRYRAGAGQGYDGVVRIAVAGYYGTGELLFDGQAVLTAAHLFTHGSTAASIMFETLAGTQTLGSSKVLVNPLYETVNNNNDLAIVWLNGSAPMGADRYGLYRGSDELGQTFTMVGYGREGTGTTGDENSGGTLRLMAQNQFDAEGAAFKTAMGGAIGWSPALNTQLLADFDNGLASNDALGRLMGKSGLGLGLNEGLIAAGDSGGPALINGQVAGVVSYGASVSTGVAHPDVDDVTNATFGEIAAWTRVSYYQQWIDQNLRAQYAHAPVQPADVQKAVEEGNAGTTHAYFLLQFTGVRVDPNQVLSVDYATRDGTAVAGQDYVAAKGVLKLYPGETQAVVLVEIVGDTKAEPDEYFYLDVTHPVGGGFGDGVAMLTAVRTIVNDDGFYAA